MASLVASAAGEIDATPTSRRPTPDVAPRSAFRSDIQALRALAVTAVVLYHLFPDLVPGGFIGVDVFFVISGWLITQHLVEEVNRTGRIRLRQFWARRIRRLLPASFAVLAASIVLVVGLMPRVTWQANLQEIGASTIYLQNWLLGIHAVDYLAAQETPTVAQHYWSLSVEEQFYVAWPLLILAGVVLSRFVHRLSLRHAVLLVLALAAGGSFLFCLWLTSTQPALAFFATPTRVWEFAVGGLLVLASPAIRSGRASVWGAAASWAGILLIVLGALQLTGHASFPGWLALIPVAGAALVLAGGHSSAPPSTSRLFNLRVVQWIGDCSYSIYLWHWPFIIVAPWVLHGPAGLGARLVIVALTAVLAYLTARYVETPARNGRRWRATSLPAFAFTVVGMAVLLAVAGVLFNQVQRTNDARSAAALARIADNTPCFGAAAILPENGCPAPFARPTDLDPAFAAADIFAPARPCQQDLGPSTVTLCTFGATEAPSKTIAVVGNSHALRLIPALDRYGKEHGWEILLAAKTECTGLTTAAVGDFAPRSCLAWSRELQDKLLSMPGLDGVVFASHVSAESTLAGNNPSPQNVAAASDAVVATWTTIKQHGIPVIVTGDVPGMRPDSSPECIAASDATYDPCAVPRSDVVQPNLMTQLAQRRPDLVTYVDLTKYFCDAELCHDLIGGVIVYSDSHHLTATMSASLGRYLGADIGRVVSPMVR